MKKIFWMLLISSSIFVFGLMKPSSVLAKQGSCPTDYYECKCPPPGKIGIGKGATTAWACCNKKIDIGIGDIRICSGALYFEDPEHGITADPKLKGLTPQGYGPSGSGETLRAGPKCCHIHSGKEFEDCEDLGPDDQGISTSLGCLPTSTQGFMAWIFKSAIFIAGGIAFLLMGWGAFLLITSQGNPEQIKGGQEIIVSAGAGLLFIIFAVFMLRLIGFDILKIPGFE